MSHSGIPQASEADTEISSVIDKKISASSHVLRAQYDEAEAKIVYKLVRYNTVKERPDGIDDATITDFIVLRLKT